MQLTDKHIIKFQILYLEKFGIEISKAEAVEKGVRLVRLMEIILKNKNKKIINIKKWNEKGLTSNQ